MAFTPGAKLGPYEIVSLLGAGGMGEVYQAKDTRLDRTVAIKVLLNHLTANADLKARFDREAKVISSLQHTHICVLHDVGNDAGTDYLVMEYLDGETLASRLARKSLTIEEVLKIGIEIADALDKAHKQGIIHRDLKPGNVMLTKSGSKLMDFGLAKPAGFGSGTTGSGAPAFSATMSVQASPITTAGTVVGTVQYMSPEQIQGLETDARSDIFAFGAMLYEMLTGKRAFEGKTQLKVAGAILENDPEPVTNLQPLTPPALAHLVERCMDKEPDTRWQTMGDVRAVLRWIAEGGSTVNMPVVTSHKRSRREHITQIAAAVLLIGLITVAYMHWHVVSQPVPVIRGNFLPPEKLKQNIRELAISPDGKNVVYAATSGSDWQLWLQPIDATTPHLLSGTEGAGLPFWSGDSKSIGFFAQGKLKRVEAAGGPPQIICDAFSARGGTWNKEGVILFEAESRAPLTRVAAGGGTPVPVTDLKAPQAGTHRWPYFLPDGKHFLFMTSPSGGENNENAIYWGSLDSKETKLVTKASTKPVYAAGYLLFRRESSLMAQLFDAKQGTLSGDATPIVEQIRYSTSNSHVEFTASETGILAYQTGASVGNAQLTWYDSKGVVKGTVGKLGNGIGFRLSPDGKELAQSIADSSGNNDVWIYDLARNVPTRLTFMPTVNSLPVWTPDGKKIAFASNQAENHFQLFMKNADGSGKEERILEDKDDDRITDISRDGNYAVFFKPGSSGNSGFDLWILSMTGERKAEPYLTTNYNEFDGRVSPDGHWLTYTSNESGKNEVYISTFPKFSSKWQVSTGGGTRSVWGPNGKEIYYKSNDNKLMVVPLTFTANSVKPGQVREMFPLPLLQGPNLNLYDVTRDGRIIANVTNETTTATPISFVVNWVGMMKK